MSETVYKDACMIAIMRKLIDNKICKFILWMFLIMMAIGALSLGKEKKWAIKVYDQTITDNKFHLMLKAAKHQQENFRQKGVVFSNKNIEKETLESSVSSLLGEHVMDSLSLTVPSYIIDKEVQKHLAHLPSYFFLQSGELNQEAFRRLIAPHTIEDFLEDLHLESKNRLFYSIVDLSVYSPKFELALQYNVDFAQKSYSIIVLPLQKFISQTKQHPPSEDVLAMFYKKPKNNEQFKTQEKRAGIVWRFDEGNYAISISDNDVKSYYEKSKSLKYLISPAQVQVRALLLKLEPGKDAEIRLRIEGLREQAEKAPDNFTSLIKEFSQGDDASKGGLSDFFEQDDKKLDKTFVRVAFESLSKDGQISIPIKTDRGYELVQRVKRNPAKYKDLKSVENEIKKELSSSKFKQRFQQDATRVLNQAKYHPEVLDKFVDRYKGSKKELSLDVRKGGIDMTHLFKTDEHKYSTFFDKETGVILTCSEIEKKQSSAT